MRTIWALHILSAAILGVALVNGGFARARRAPPQSLSIAAINQQACSDTTVPGTTMAAMFNAEVLLDRLDLSPGVIDGKAGENAGKAIRAFQRSRSLVVNGNLDQATWNKLCESRRAPVLIAYMVTEDDVRGPFLRKIPRNFEGMASLRALSYRSVAQLLAEKFHTSEELIKLLNPGKTLDRAGTIITVPNVVDARPDGQVLRIEVDKPAKAVRAFGRNDELVAFYPASIGSREKPAPSGTYGIRQVVKNPTYHYDPRSNSKGCEPIRNLRSRLVPTIPSAWSGSI